MMLKTRSMMLQARLCGGQWITASWRTAQRPSSCRLRAPQRQLCVLRRNEHFKHRQLAAVPTQGLPAILGSQLFVTRSRGFEQRRPSSTVVGQPSPSAELNKKILELGKSQKWQEILSLYQDNRQSFNNVNYATTMNQLARIRATRTDDPQLHRLVEDIDRICVRKGLSWLGLRGTSNVMHSIAKMNLENEAALRIVHGLEVGPNARQFVGNAPPQNIANAIWACAKLGVKSPRLLSALDDDLERFIEHAEVQHISNTCYALTVLHDDNQKHNKGLVERLWDALLQLDPSELKRKDLRQMSEIRGGAQSCGISLSQPPAKLQQHLNKLRMAKKNLKRKYKVY